ncbi:MAG: SRPBCC domain-containing protein [Gemmatimonadetes bacterium]|nr:SRPBCC domain-containing protein [Gemmatimonadota bacterium]
MRRPALSARATDSATCRAETGRSIDEWIAWMTATGASGRSALGKALLAEKVDAWWATVLQVSFEAATGIVERDGRPKGYSLCTTKTVSAPVARVWQAITTHPEFACGPVTKSRDEKALVMPWAASDWAPSSVVEILLQPKDGKTGLVVNHTRIQDRHDADLARAAWERALAELKAQLEE